MSWETTKTEWVKKIEEARAMLESVASAIHASAPFKAIDNTPAIEYVQGLKWLPSKFENVSAYIPADKVPDRLVQIINANHGRFNIGSWDYLISARGNAIKVVHQ